MCLHTVLPASTSKSELYPNKVFLSAWLIVQRIIPIEVVLSRRTINVIFCCLQLADCDPHWLWRSTALSKVIVSSSITITRNPTVLSPHVKINGVCLGFTQLYLISCPSLAPTVYDLLHALNICLMILMMRKVLSKNSLSYKPQGFYRHGTSLIRKMATVKANMDSLTFVCSS